jgi:hypothetical protein
VAGLTCFNRGTRALRPRATEHDAPTARKYDCVILETDKGVDLLALALLIATLRDWLVICQSRVPVVCKGVSYGFKEIYREHTPRPGVSMPAVTTKFDKTKHDIRNGRKTGSPVSVEY